MDKQNIFNLVDSIASGNTLDIENNFNTIMMSKISERIDTMRVDVAKSMFSESVIEEKLTLEDFSIEELEDFMVSEEFEQLDELSKQTLGSYIKKASHDVAGLSAEVRGQAVKSHDAYDKHEINAARKHADNAEKLFSKSWNRRKNIAKAVDKLTK